eukprot:TRINITY_DN67557_c0_g1_i1.p1 TRINITY_DN67557_c0_g1~~TRINITY_DN67557_c0_g1_i1.p1  ORF type:complete len:391 (-),score=55.91 TRINITY_DN67557_c0_g1_i1:541-1614(-)
MSSGDESRVWKENPEFFFDNSICPTDGISCLKFSPTADFLASTSWDNQIRVYEIQHKKSMMAKVDWNVVPKTMQNLEAPILSCAWNQDGSALFTGAGDKTVKQWDLSSNNVVQIGAHDAPCRHVFHCPELNCVISGSWDKTIRMWDTRAPNQIQSLALPDKCSAMDVRGKYCVVACANNQFGMVDLTNPQKFMDIPEKMQKSQIAKQIRCVSLMTDGIGYVYGNNEGRCQVNFFDEDHSKNRFSFSFKCHRNLQPHNKAECYPINCIVSHPTFHTFATCGGDGSFNLWDCLHRKKLRSSSTHKQSISCGAFNSVGNIFACAESDDWMKGHEHHNPADPNRIMLKIVDESDVKDRGSL